MPGLATGQRVSVGHWQTESAEDGFWLSLAGIAAGSLIRYRYLIRGRWQEATTVAEAGDRQFIYTGGTPEQMAIIDIGAVGGDAVLPPPAPEPPWPAVPPPTPVPPAPAPERFFGHPPAY